jgi:5'-nucleotidase (lipoprotein e(P4) family)
MMILLFLCSFLSACTSIVTTENNLGLLWRQASGEYRAVCLQTYKQALEAVRQYDPASASKPPAIVADLDETVLDNGRFHAYSRISGRPFSQERWDEWVRESVDPTRAYRVGAVPGAVDFINAVLGMEKGITMVYVSNRNDYQLEDSQKALRLIGVRNVEQAVFLLKSPGMKTKQSRYREVASRYEIIAMLGDSLGDFMGEIDPATGESEEVTGDNPERYQARWGNQWFMIPNPVYGSWTQPFAGENAAKDFFLTQCAEKCLNH